MGNSLVKNINSSKERKAFMLQLLNDLKALEIMLNDGLFEKEVDLTRENLGGMVHIVFAVDGFPYRLLRDLHFVTTRIKQPESGCAQ